MHLHILISFSRYALLAGAVIRIRNTAILSVRHTLDLCESRWFLEWNPRLIPHCIIMRFRFPQNDVTYNSVALPQILCCNGCVRVVKLYPTWSLGLDLFGLVITSTTGSINKRWCLFLVFNLDKAYAFSQNAVRTDELTENCMVTSSLHVLTHRDIIGRIECRTTHGVYTKMKGKVAGAARMTAVNMTGCSLSERERSWD